MRLHHRDGAMPPRDGAMVFPGYDHAGGHYVAHWIDVFGGHFPRTLRLGQREGAHAIRFAVAGGGGVVARAARRRTGDRAF